MDVSKKSRLTLGIVLCALLLGIIANAYPVKSSCASEEMTGTQDVRSLDRRISLLEQRFYTIELNISRLQQSALSQRSPVPSPSARDQEINLIREEIQRLSLRLSEIECGLVKLDERTAVSVGDTRKGAGAKPVDPCRLKPATPLRLSTRP